jgi:hypothetical protein
MRTTDRALSLVSIPVAILLLVITASCAGPSREGTRALAEIQTRADGVRSFRGSTLDTSGPMPVLTLTGPPYEQGFAYGVLLHKEIGAVYAEFSALKEGTLARASGLKRALAKRFMSKYVRGFERRTPERYREEMRGLADGAGIPYDDVLTVSSGSVMLMACTSVLVAGGEGGLLHGRNFDFRPSFLGENPILVRHEAKTGVPSWNLSVVGYLPAFNGANDAGISVSLNASDANADRPGGRPMGWLLRDVLSNATDLDSVRRIIHGSANDDLDWIVIVGSAREKDGVVFDLKGEVQAETRLDPAKPLIVLNRMFGDGRHADDGLAKAHLDPLEDNDPFNVLRWSAIQRFLASNTVDSVDAMWSFLRDRGGESKDLFFTDGSVANQATMFAVVFDLGAGRLTAATGSSWAPLREVWSFDLAARNFAPHLPADPIVADPGFLARERKYLALEAARVAGRLDVSMLDEALDPIMLAVYGTDLVDSERPDPRFMELLRKAAEANPDLPGLSLTLGYLQKDTDPASAISSLERALSSPVLDPLRRLYVLKHLANTHAGLGHGAEAARTAARWLEEEKVLVAGHDVQNDYLDETKARMEQIVAGKR